MSDYRKLFNRIWNDPDFTALEGDPQRVYMMLLSYPTRDNAGVLPMTMRRWVKATKGMTVERFTAALRALSAAGFVVIDWDAEEVLIRTFIKNDENYRQPNVWYNAVKSALKVQSELIRRHIVKQVLDAASTPAAAKWKQDTVEDVDALVSTVSEGYAEGLKEAFEEGFPQGLAEGLREGFPKPPGAGALLTRPPSTPAPAPATAPAAAPDDRAIEAVSATPGADIVMRLVPDGLSSATKCGLRMQASALIHDGAEPGDVKAAVELWLTKTGIGPGVLPSLHADVIKSRNGATRNGSTTSGVDAKGSQWLTGTARLASQSQYELEV